MSNETNEIPFYAKDPRPALFLVPGAIFNVVPSGKAVELRDTSGGNRAIISASSAQELSSWLVVIASQVADRGALDEH